MSKKVLAIVGMSLALTSVSVHADDVLPIEQKPLSASLNTREVIQSEEAPSKNIAGKIAYGISMFALEKGCEHVATATLAMFGCGPASQLVAKQVVNFSFPYATKTVEVAYNNYRDWYQSYDDQNVKAPTVGKVLSDLGYGYAGVFGGQIYHATVRSGVSSLYDHTLGAIMPDSKGATIFGKATVGIGTVIGKRVIANNFEGAARSIGNALTGFKNWYYAKAA